MAGYTTRKIVAPDDEALKALTQLKREVAKQDLASAAARIGAHFDGNRLTLKILGKDFSVDSKGDLFSDIHIHTWVAVPFLHHILAGKGIVPTGRWLHCANCPTDPPGSGLFGQRCEQPLKRIADRYPDLFEDLIRLFNGRMADPATAIDADIALILHPLPRLPMLIRYWKAESGLSATLNLFFDATAEDNLPIESIFALATGLVRMLEKIVLRHGITGD
jgi:hypothetical protein